MAILKVQAKEPHKNAQGETIYVTQISNVETDTLMASIFAPSDEVNELNFNQIRKLLIELGHEIN